MAEKQHVIDLDIDPPSYIHVFEPSHPDPDADMLLHQHKPMGQLVWDPRRIYLLLSLGQMSVGYISGRRVREEIAHERVLNGNLLDYLLLNQHLIPENWKRYEICFWSTIYKTANKLKSPKSFVRCLIWGRGHWYCDDVFGGWMWKEGSWKSLYLDFDSEWTHLRRAAVLIDI